MPSVERSIVINVPPERIWEISRDPANWHTWFEGTTPPKSVQGSGDAGTVVETSLSIASMAFPTQIKVVEAIPAVLWKGEFSTTGATGTQQWAYERVGGGTQLTFKMEADLSGPAKLAEGLLTKSFEQMADKTLANLKSLSEK
jgi:carbon monoxide dehydrogenase subunit G